MQKYILYTDGGARGNPGPAAAGVVIYDAHLKEVDKFAHYLGVATNNQAEYQALILGLGRIQKLVGDAHKIAETAVEVFMDSELIVKQLSGEYRVKNKDLKPLVAKVEELVAKFAAVKFQHIFRDKNTLADKLLNIELDKHTV
ncbi:MAG: ribonuclease HI family protein [Patescibacteria group bacterium]|jgi:ribonuclease HI